MAGGLQVNELQSSIRDFFEASSQLKKVGDKDKNQNSVPGVGQFSYALPDYEVVKSMYERAAKDPNIHMQDYLPGGNQYSNINAKSRSETLRLSRLADALNNRYYRSPRATGNYSRTFGGGVTGEGPSQGQLYQMPVVTEESREMGRQGQYEGMQRSAELARQQGAMDLALEYEKMRQQAAFQRTQSAFERELTNIQIPSRQAKIIADLAVGKWPLAQLLAGLFGGTSAPTPQQIYYQKELGNIAERGEAAGLSNEQIYGQISGAVVKLGAAGIAQQFNLAPEAAKNVYDQLMSGMQGVAK